MLRLGLAFVLVVATAVQTHAAPDVEARDSMGETALMRAAKAGKPDEIKALLAQGANIEAKHPKVYDGATPLVLALHFDQHDAAKLLIDRGASVAGKIGTEALVLAARSGFDDLVDRLVAAKVTPKGTSALHLAARFGRVSTVRKLVKAGAVVRAVDKDDHDYTPFIVACQEHQVEAARVLLELGANVNDVDSDGTPALHWAVYAERPDEIHIYEKLSQPHHTVFRPRKDAPLVALLVRKRAKLDAVDADGNTALHHAVLMDAQAAAKVLLAAGAKRNVRNKAGKTAREIATERNNSVEPLLRTGK